ncbi:hypothetical protein [Muricoccus radiodurans]|uniref:hypothetical protein n=1 Tax=Muricoccus radiodurans TaxID=2231721 RepID=UPI003CE8F1CF
MFGGFSTSSASAAGSATSTFSSAASVNQARALHGGHQALGIAGRLPVAMLGTHRGAANYDRDARPGDVFIQIAPGGFIGHCNIISPDRTYKIDSMDPDGVRKVRLSSDRKPAIVFRFFDRDVALRAANLALGWAPERDYHPILNPEPEARVQYSNGAIGLGVTARVVHNIMGSSKFGKGAQGRLLKYRGRANMSPKNMICSELCVLAFQLAMPEGAPGFPMLDAKHTSPIILYNYLTGPGQAHWKVVGQRNING